MVYMQVEGRALFTVRSSVSAVIVAHTPRYAREVAFAAPGIPT